MLYHRNDGTHISKEELENKLWDIFKNDDWIIDGNYQKTLEMRIKKCDTVFLLDFSTDICLEGEKSRIEKNRDDLPWIEEKLDVSGEKKQLDYWKIMVKQETMDIFLEQKKDTLTWYFLNNRFLIWKL